MIWWPIGWEDVSVYAVDLDTLTNPTVRAAIGALQTGDKRPSAGSGGARPLPSRTIRPFAGRPEWAAAALIGNFAVSW
jgi:hypothetical protein